MEILRVLTLNIWNRQGPWDKRVALIRRGIAALQPDLVALQEVLHHDAHEGDQATEIAEGFGYHVAFGSAWHIGGGLQFGNAVLSRWPIAARHLWQLPGGVSDDETRALLGVEVDAPCGRVPFFSTHLNWRLHESAIRVKQVASIAERVKEVGAPGLFPAILAGDFNAEPESDEIRFLRGWHAIDGQGVFFADCFHWAGEGPGVTFARRNTFAATVHEPDRRLDYLFVRGPDRQFRGEPLRARVVLDEAEDGAFPSDHFGVYAEIQAAPRPAG